MSKKHDTKTLPKWAQQRMRELESRAERMEMTLPWTKPGMEWFTLFHPDHRAKDDPREFVHLFTLSETGAHTVASIGRKDTVFIGRGA